MAAHQDGWQFQCFTVTPACGPICANMTSSIKPEAHNISQRQQMRTEPRPQATQTISAVVGSFVAFVHRNVRYQCRFSVTVWIATACDCWLLEQNKMRYVRGQTNTHTDGQTDTVITSVFAALPYQERRNKHIKQVKLIIWRDIHIKIKCTHKTWPTQDTEHPAICYTHSWRSCVCHDIGHNRTMSLREVFFQLAFKFSEQSQWDILLQEKRTLFLA